GAFFVALQDAEDRTAVTLAIGSALGIRENPGRDIEQAVKDYLKERELLMVLDNFEQALSAAPMVADLVAGSPRLRLIVTSRAALHISSEQEYEVPPLSLPDPKNLPPLAALSQYESVALFIDRAISVRSDFAITNENAPAVAEICSRLDGLPLAIELAAARMRLLTPEAVLARLEQSLPLLTGGARDLPARQQTLRGAIDWSYQLLGEAERRLFERLAVFAGGWTVDAAEKICNPSAEVGIETLDGLTTLADNSLVRPTPADGEDDRFAMLQVIREFAGERFDAGEDAEEVRRRHALYMAALADEAEPQLRRSELRHWQHRLRREDENLRTAMRWAIENGEAEIGLRTAGALWDFWHYWGELREGRSWLEPLLELPGAEAPTATRARALTALGGLVYWQGDGEGSGKAYDEALAIYRELGDEEMIGRALNNSAWAAAARLDVPLALQNSEEAIEHYRRAGAEADARLTRAWMTVAPLIVGAEGAPAGQPATGVPSDPEGALRESLQILRELGRVHDAGDMLESKVLLDKAKGDYAGAKATARESLQVWNDLGTLGRLPLHFKMVAALELAQGRPGRAVRLAAASDRYKDELGGELADWVFPVGNPLEESRPLLAPEEYAQAAEEGRAMTVEEAVKYSLEEG
ncbi:MAG: hypothetical protein M3O87_04340, partial [Candidatus Dormibacteraeota bacterium]|nr:hypothetical protein [Candidatus Dormibacteraeota bacterium]